MDAARHRQGGQAADRAGRPARRRGGVALPGAGPVGAGRRRCLRPAVRQRPRPRAARLGCPAHPGGGSASRGPARAIAARPPAYVCHSSPGGRCRSEKHPGAARPRIGRHHPGIHPCERAAPESRARAGTPPRMSDDALQIWIQYKQSADPHLRERLILTYAPLVKYVAGRLGTGLPAHVEEGDLVSYGLLGLMNAIERYDPGRDITFETYAISRIKGPIIDELRSLDWVPRSVRSRAREIERAITELEHRLHRPPTDEEIASHIGVSDDEFQDSLTAISRSSVAALDELWTIGSSGGDTVSLIDTLQDPNADDPSTEMSRVELREALAGAIGKLPERERTVITLYYYEELTLREIGEVLGVTESRVSQLHTKAILRLKAKLQGSLERASLERNR